MDYHFRNLVFEGGGVKGLAYVGAMEALEERAILKNIKRIGGTSAGAIYAALAAVGYSSEEMWKIIEIFDFERLLDGSHGPLKIIDNTLRMMTDYGWYKGDFFHKWMKGLIIDKVGTNITFQQLHEMTDRPDLYLCGTDLSRRQSVIFSHETTPTMTIVEAIRISMSIPLFFKAVKQKVVNSVQKDVYVDGGVLNNYPVQLFDLMKYIDENERDAIARETDYYKSAHKAHPDMELHVYNKQTLGFRLSPKDKVPAYGTPPVKSRLSITNIYEYTLALGKTFLGTQDDFHLHNDDWHRTIFIDIGNIDTIDFKIGLEGKTFLKNNGRLYTEKYFDWFDKPEEDAFNKPLILKKS